MKEKRISFQNQLKKQIKKDIEKTKFRYTLTNR